MADAFHGALKSTREPRGPHRNPDRTVGGSLATAKKLLPPALTAPPPQTIKGKEDSENR